MDGITATNDVFGIADSPVFNSSVLLEFCVLCETSLFLVSAIYLLLEIAPRFGIAPVMFHVEHFATGPKLGDSGGSSHAQA